MYTRLHAYDYQACQAQTVNYRIIDHLRYNAMMPHYSRIAGAKNKKLSMAEYVIMYLLLI